MFSGNTNHSSAWSALDHSSGKMMLASDKYSFIHCSSFKKNTNWQILVYHIPTLLQVPPKFYLFVITFFCDIHVFVRIISYNPDEEAMSFFVHIGWLLAWNISVNILFFRIYLTKVNSYFRYNNF